MNRKITTSLIIISVMVLVLIGASLFQADRVMKAFMITSRAMDIGFKANEIVVSNVAVNYELWKYFGMTENPREFLNQEMLLSGKIEDFSLFANNHTDAMCDGCLIKFNKVLEKLTREDRENNYNEIFKRIEELKTIRNDKSMTVNALNISKEIEQDLSKIILSEMGLSEELKKISDDQISYSKNELIADVFTAIERNKIINLGLAGAYMSMLALIAVWLGRLIKETRINCLKLNNK